MEVKVLRHIGTSGDEKGELFENNQGQRLQIRPPLGDSSYSLVLIQNLTPHQTTFRQWFVTVLSTDNVSFVVMIDDKTALNVPDEQQQVLEQHFPVKQYIPQIQEAIEFWLKKRYPLTPVAFGTPQKFT